ncbi:hypothetical protein [Nubsella zeaxanthinifaciens]|uniref:hypothetical protein n=1 Tax=Nubsella zeaxanthinifaciens TaxID=392412 RepID=UPI000DE2A950|nr:hypothetical protein [Nubsella zeaxanthinifaciens]
MELKIEMKQQLDQLLAKPAKVTQNDIPLLQELIAAYPYYQPLYLLLAKASKDTAQQQEALTKAALYNNGFILHRVIHSPQQLVALQDVEVTQYATWNKVHTEVSNEDVPANIPSKESLIIEDAPEIENLAPLAHEIIEVEISTEVAEGKAEQQDEETAPNAAVLNNDYPFPEIENIEPLQSEIIKVCDASSAAEDPATAEPDEQETFEEINELVIPADFSISDDYEIAASTSSQPNEEIDLADDNFSAETFAATDFFAFDLSATVTDEVQVAEDENIAEEQPEPETPNVEKTVTENVISKYDDDKLPFTFLWWLAKTRKDHEQIFRPFVSSTKGLAPAQHLQQQYVENIFHLQAPFELENELEQPVEPKNKKENEIIESFIKNDPQIKALPPNQINTENKAKKSAEDGNDLVSETLAQIYIEQMLYHKAIDTYQKLSLKFPEKSRYFADLIQSLEKKI